MAFHVTQPPSHFINPCGYRDDLARGVVVELRKQNVTAKDEPGQENFGWYLNFEVAGLHHFFVV
jgi:hypothetical protein